MNQDQIAARIAFSMWLSDRRVERLPRRVEYGPQETVWLVYTSPSATVEGI